MKISIVMLEIRKIRDENSARHLKMTDEERRKEEIEALDWFSRTLGKDVKIQNQTNKTK